MPATTLRQDAIAIWQAGVEAVRADRLVEQNVRVDGDALTICGRTFSLSGIRRIVVVGAGKAGAGMSAGFERAVGPSVLKDKVSGWVNVPADCLRSLQRIHLHAARPAGHNEPTQAGVDGTDRILSIVGELDANDLCVVLLSGGASALLPAPVEGITLTDKQAVTRWLMHAGASIQELNTVRKQLSRVKGGGLARGIAAEDTVVLIISDVIGDPLDIIGSGPTVADSSTPAGALAVLDRYEQAGIRAPQAVRSYLHSQASREPVTQRLPAGLSNHVIGNNAVALAAAQQAAERLGYRVLSLGTANAGEATTVGRQLAQAARAVRDTGQPVAAPACLLWGGESTVRLQPTVQPRRGGRNQEVTLAALDALSTPSPADPSSSPLDRLIVLSGGTDGEDGPTDAAGGIADSDVLETAWLNGLDPAEFLAVHDSYAFFSRTGGSLKTGPTQTNVMDLAVVLVGK